MTSGAFSVRRPSIANVSNVDFFCEMDVSSADVSVRRANKPNVSNVHSFFEMAKGM